MTPFEKRVLRETLKIPLGQTRTYQWLAKKCGRPRAWRAVANALAKNPFVLFIPCHRVVSGNGKPGGYVLGGKMKRDLIKFEQNIKNMIQ